MNPSGLCLCGCGGKTTLSPYSWARVGRVKGQPVDYLPGHYAKVREHKQQQSETMQARRRRTQKQGPYKAGATLKAKAVARKIEAALRRKA